MSDLKSTGPLLVVIRPGAACEFHGEEGQLDGPPPWAICEECLPAAKKALERVGISHVQFDVGEEGLQCG